MSPSPETHLRPARRAAASIFFVEGMVLANAFLRLPDFDSGFERGTLAYGLALAPFSTGAILAGLAAAPLLRRFGSARVAVALGIGVGVCFLGAGLAPGWPVLAAMLLVAGGVEAIAAVARNACGLQLQRLAGRSLLNSLYAVSTLGGLLGGVIGAAASALHVPVALHLGAIALLAAGLLVSALPHLTGLSAPVGEASPGGASTDRRGLAFGIAALAGIGFAGALVDDVANAWAGDAAEASALGASVAGIAFIAFVAAQLGGQLFGDRVVDRFGHRPIAQAGSAIACVGMGAALLLPSAPATIFGFLLAGLGVATLLPAAMRGADELPGLRPGTGLTVVRWLVAFAFLVAANLALVSDAEGSRAALYVGPLACGVAAVLLGLLPTARPVADPNGT